MLKSVLVILCVILSEVQAAEYIQSNYYSAGGCSSNLIQAAVIPKPLNVSIPVGVCYLGSDSSDVQSSSIYLQSDGKLNYTGFSGKVFVTEYWANTTDCKNVQASSTSATVAESCFLSSNVGTPVYQKYALKDNVITFLSCSDSQCTSCNQTYIPSINCLVSGNSASSYKIVDAQNPNSAAFVSVNLMITMFALLLQLVYQA